MRHLIAEEAQSAVGLADLQIVGDLQRLLVGRQFGDVVGREEADLAQTLALPPIGVARIDHRHFVAGPAFRWRETLFLYGHVQEKETNKKQKKSAAYLRSSSSD